MKAQPPFVGHHELQMLQVMQQLRWLPRALAAFFGVSHVTSLVSHVTQNRQAGRQAGHRHQAPSQSTADLIGFIKPPTAPRGSFYGLPTPTPNHAFTPGAWSESAVGSGRLNFDRCSQQFPYDDYRFLAASVGFVYYRGLRTLPQRWRFLTTRALMHRCCIVQGNCGLAYAAQCDSACILIC